MRALQNYDRRRHVPGLVEVMDEIGPIPSEAVLMGIAHDGLPVMFNASNVNSPNMLIWGGKIEFLQLIAQHILLNQRGSRRSTDVEFVILTSDPSQWHPVMSLIRNRTDSPCVGIVPIYSDTAEQLVLSLSEWVHKNRNPYRSTIVLVDDMEKLLDMEFSAKQDFQHILVQGPKARVFTVGLVKTNLSFKWNGAFQMEIHYDKTQDTYELRNREQDGYVNLHVSLPGLVTL